jgi:hypothetical protein
MIPPLAALYIVVVFLGFILAYLVGKVGDLADSVKALDATVDSLVKRVAKLEG